MTLSLPYHDKPSPWSSHSRLVARLATYPRPCRVLDVGTASGTLGRMCQGQGLMLFGIEAQPEWAALAAPFYEHIWATPAETAPPAAVTGYDVVVLADVLEHMAAPEAVLQSLVAQQNRGSRFLISVPNVANLWVRLNLLWGRFDYTERGILDRTHLRFFTRKTLLNLVQTVGLTALSIQVTPIPLELVNPRFASPSGQRLVAAFAGLTSALPTLLGYQFLVEAQKP